MFWTVYYSDQPVWLLLLYVYGFYAISDRTTVWNKSSKLVRYNLAPLRTLIALIVRTGNVTSYLVYTFLKYFRLALGAIESYFGVSIMTAEERATMHRKARRNAKKSSLKAIIERKKRVERERNEGRGGRKSSSLIRTRLVQENSKMKNRRSVIDDLDEETSNKLENSIQMHHLLSCSESSSSESDA